MKKDVIKNYKILEKIFDIFQNKQYAFIWDIYNNTNKSYNCIANSIIKYAMNIDQTKE